VILLTRDTIDYAGLVEAVRRPNCGAVAAFLGTVRDLTDGRVTAALDYEAYPGMAEKKLAEIEDEVRGR
jgi:molybdopterin synthase catalytic subunit